MEESIKKIVKTIFIIVIVTGICILYFYLSTTFSERENRKGIGIDNRKIDIKILDDKILCEDVIDFNLSSTKEIDYKFFQEYSYLNNVEISINNHDSFYSSVVRFGLLNGSINITDDVLDLLDITDGNISVKLSYELDMDYITRYTNTDVFSCFIDMANIDYLNNLTINLTSNNTISNLVVNNATVSQTINGYAITMDNVENSTNMDILFKINTTLNNTINSDYINEEILEETKIYSYINERIHILVILIIVSVILLIASFIINHKRKITNYRKETSGLISPILAESVIDGKIGLKELIMTTIIELNIRGNINIINNNVLELVSCNNLEPYEHSIVDLLFNNKIIKFSDINNVFAKSNKETLQFSEKMNSIKNCLLDKIYSMNIFSRGLTLLSKIIGLCAILIILNLPQILFYSEMSDFTLQWFVILSLLVSFFYIRSSIRRKPIREEIISNNVKRKLYLRVTLLIIFILFILISAFIYLAKYNIIFIILVLVIVGLNIYIVYRSQGDILTRKGKEEQAKLIELKNYINDYSLIKNRDLESVIIWDEYLAYATAFGIPSKVTSSIFEGWYNLNINLQLVQKILSS